MINWIPGAKKPYIQEFKDNHFETFNKTTINLKI